MKFIDILPCFMLAGGVTAFSTITTTYPNGNRSVSTDEMCPFNMDSVPVNYQNQIDTSNSSVPCANFAIQAVTSKKFKIGDQLPIYMTIQSKSAKGSTNLTYQTAQFFPKIDEMSYLIVPHPKDYSLLEPNLQVWTYVYKNESEATGIRYTPTRKRWYGTDSIIHPVPFRSVIITLTNGYVTSVDWETSFCVLSAAVNCIDDMSADETANCTPYDPSDVTTSCHKFKVYVMWAGSDSTGKYLTSASKSVYRLTMLP